MATFLDELAEHVGSFNDDLMALEKNPTDDERGRRMQSLFRTAHSLKGAARAVNLEVIERTCHLLEDQLAAVRDQRGPLERDLFELLFAAADALEEAGMRLREQRDLADSPLAALASRLEAGANLPLPTAKAPTVARPPPTPPVAGPGSPDPAPSEGPGTAVSVRVRAEKLDSLLARVGELLAPRRRLEARKHDLTSLRDFVARWKTQWGQIAPELRKLAGPLPSRTNQVLLQAADQLRRLDKDLERLTDAVAADGRMLDQVAGPLDDEVRRVRLLPFNQACEGMERMARDLAQAGGKDVELAFAGGEVELDRSVLEGLKDPLRHLVRNAIDHGVEPPGRRLASGKPARAKVTVAAALRGAQVEVVVEDDGAGLDLAALRETARKRGLGDLTGQQDLARLVFLPGVSTAPIITDVSGRGVGLDVVKSRVEALHGTVELVSEPGKGTRFVLTVPLTLTTLRAVLFTVAGRTCAFAGTNVHQLVRVPAAEFLPVVGRPMLRLNGQLVPVARLASVLDAGVAGAPWPPGKIPLIVVAAGDQRVAFAVDDFLAEQEILIKSLGARLRRLRFVAGATLLATGAIALVLNAANLVRAALAAPIEARSPDLASTPDEIAAAAEQARKRLLVVEDSLTTRTLMKSILESAGYDVATAADGEIAWDLLQQQPVDLIISDVEMPRLDGVGLTERVRASGTFRNLPLVLVTARESEQDKLRGVQAGANAYLVKSAFDQSSLLEIVGQLL
jgi:two-component system chemotaxis sensor kinase CheA